MTATSTPCTADPDVWFDPATVKRAIAACRTCPLQVECAELGVPERWGVWGGIDRTVTRERTGTPQPAPRGAARAATYTYEDIAAAFATGSTADVAAQFGVSERTVLRAAQSLGVIRPAPNTCQNGHTRTDANTRQRAGHGATCLDCVRERGRARRERTAA